MIRNIIRKINGEDKLNNIVFPNCCGINIVYDLGYKPSETTIQNQIDIARHQRRGIVLIAISEEQPSVKKTLEKMKFKCVYKFINPNSGNTVFLYLKPTR